jgi:hypothetical protein
MTRRLSLLLVGIPALVLIGGLNGRLLPGRNAAPSAGGLSVVLWIDATISVTEAMANFIWDEDAPRDGIFKGSKTPASLGDAFSGPVNTGFIQRLTTDDRARIGSVAKSLTLSPSFTADRGALRGALRAALDVRREDRYGPTPLWDAVAAGIEALKDASGRRAIVLVTDGMATGNRRSLDDVIRQSTASGVSVSLVCEKWGPIRSNLMRMHLADSTGNTWTMMRGAFGRPPEINLQRLTAATGGVFELDGDSGSLPDPAAALTRVLVALHSGR